VWAHPNFAALVHPLFCRQKRGFRKVGLNILRFFLSIILTLFAACRREGGRAKQRPGELILKQHSANALACGLTRTSLRWFTLSFAGKKEGKKIKYDN
jgi:hypothetical protein